MRKLLFRGKEKGTGKWAFGNFYQHEKGVFISWNRCDALGNFGDRYNPVNNVVVEPETVGQFTGKYDNNMRRIFDGDIVEFETNVNNEEVKPFWVDCIEKPFAVGGGTYLVRKDQGVVQWNEAKGMWDLKVYNNGRYKRKSLLFTFRSSGYKVVGNIYDNPELLKARKHEERKSILLKDCT